MTQRYLKIYPYIILVLFSIFSAPSWCMDNIEGDYLLREISKRAPGNAPHRVVFDIDRTLCIQPNVLEENIMTISSKYPRAHLIEFRNEWHSEPPYFFYSGFGEVFLTLLRWGWHVDFFSSEEKQRNEVLIPTYLKIAFDPYSQDVKTDYETLTQKGELRIFSFHHLSYKKDRPKAQDEAAGDYKKDLTVIGPIRDTILAEDDETYVVGGEQFLHIGLSWGSSYCFSSHLSSFPEKNYENKNFNPLINAPYILGILAECKTLLDEKRAASLRDALDSVLQKPASEEFRGKTPWFSCPDNNNPKMNKWISNGQMLIDNMRMGAKQRKSENEEEKSIYTIVEVDESWFKTTIKRQSLF